MRIQNPDSHKLCCLDACVFIQILQNFPETTWSMVKNWYIIHLTRKRSNRRTKAAQGVMGWNNDTSGITGIAVSGSSQ